MQLTQQPILGLPPRPIEPDFIAGEDQPDIIAVGEGDDSGYVAENWSNPVTRSIRSEHGGRLITEIPIRGEIVENPTNRTPDFDYGAITDSPNSVIGIPLGEDKSDVHQIVQVLECLAQEYGTSTIVRDYVQNEVLCDVGDNDEALMVTQVLTFVKNNMMFVNDPLGTEHVTSPEVFIDTLKKNRRVNGDCDDHVVLLNSMLASIGINTRVLGVKLPGSDVYNHVISGVYYSGEWHDVDPCAKEGPAPHYIERLTASGGCGAPTGGIPWALIGTGLLMLL